MLRRSLIMEYKSYQHIEKLGREECDGILNGTVTIQPKIDGTNSVVWLGDDGNVRAGSRKRELSLDNDNAGFMNQIIDDENIKSYLHKHPNHYVYGEYLVPHTIRTYDSDAWKKFYIFDVFELNDNYGRYLSYDEYVPLLEEFNLTYIPEIVRLENPSIEEVADCIKKTHYLMPEGATPEGVIAKNYDYKNKWGHVVWGKIVAEEFYDRKTMLRTKNHENKNEEKFEKKIANEYITEVLIRKEYAKVLNEYPNAKRNEIIGRTLTSVYESFIDEDLLTVVRKNRKCTISFLKMKTESDNRVKEVLGDELF